MDLDAAVFRYVNEGLASERLDFLFAAISEFGSIAIVVCMIGSLANEKDRARIRSAVVAVLASAAIASALCFVLKKTVSAPRPTVHLGAVRLVKLFDAGVTSARSWPSGHTTLAFALVVPFVLLRPRDSWLLPLPLAIGFSRIYVGSHFPSDVLAGALLGSLVGIAVRAYQRRVERSRVKPLERP